MYTSHGHHIKGTSTENPPSARARCGGAGLCSVCSKEIAALLANPHPEHTHD